MTKILIPTGALGIGYSRDALARGLAEKPDLIAVDGGSTDSGPHYLGNGVSKYSRSTTKSEWGELVLAAQKIKVPLVVGTAGTSGADSAVDWLVEITNEIAVEHGLSLKVAVLKSGQDAAALADALQKGRVLPLEPAIDIDADLLHSCSNIVALAGAEQIQAALETGADIVIAGRTTDTAIISALPLARGCHPGGAWHGAKIGECGALATTDPRSGTILVEFDEEGFTITPMGAKARATPFTVSAHMLYENSNPFQLYEPGGHLDVTHARYDALDDRRVRVTGSEWVHNDTYTVKLEGSRSAGYQTVSLALVREQKYVDRIEEWVDGIRQECTNEARSKFGDDFTLELRIIGQNATLGPRDGGVQIGSEVGVMGIVTSATEATSREIAKMLNPYLLHYALPEDEDMPTFAFPFSPAEMFRGEIFDFCLNHVIELENPMDAFDLEVRELGV